MCAQTNGEELKSFRFTVNTDMRFGIGISRNIGDLLANYNFGRLCLVVDSAVLNNNKLVQDLIENLGHSSKIVKIFENKISEPDYDYLDNCKMELATLEFESLMAIGGGSTLDLTKGIAVLMRNPGKAINYRGFDLVKSPALLVIAVPTTAGTGSEVTPNAVFINKKEKRKLGINTEYVRPKLAILDPLLTLSCPKEVTVSSGMDALTHVLESFVAKSATPISRMFSKEAFSLVFNSLPKIVDDMSNVELRARLLLGSYYAGIALMNSGAGPAGAMSYVLGARYNVPHGLAGAVFLPCVAKLNIEMGCLAYAPLYELIQVADRNLSEIERNKGFSEALGKLCEKLSIPESVKDFGVSLDALSFLVNESFWLKPAIEQNPVPFTEREVQMVWESLLRD